LYIFYKLNSEPGLAVARLSSDGLTVVEKLANLKISNTSKPISSNWHFKRGELDYIIFSEVSGDGLYVAKSSNGVLGPYERSNQVFISGSEFAEPNVIIENGRYHLIFGSRSSNVYLVSLEWDSDWPYAVNFTSLSSETAPVSIPTTCPQPVPCPKSVSCSEPVAVTCPMPVPCPTCPEPVKCPLPVQIPKKQSAETQDEKLSKTVSSEIFGVDDNKERSKYNIHFHDSVIINVYHHKNNDGE